MTNQGTTIDHVPRSTFFWIIGALISLQTAVLTFAAASIDQRIDVIDGKIDDVYGALSVRIDDNEEDIDLVQGDIRAILIGIEQLKNAQGIR